MHSFPEWVFAEYRLVFVRWAFLLNLHMLTHLYKSLLDPFEEGSCALRVALISVSSGFMLVSLARSNRSLVRACTLKRPCGACGSVH